MTHKTFLVADLHFGHEGMCKFLRADGTKLRPFNTAAEMDEVLVSRWNETVRPQDKVYVLGDVSLRHHGLATMARCNGDLVLIKGNHDQEDLKKYVKVFRDVRACWQLAGCLLTHIPIHPESLSRWRANIHGHLHYRRVMKDDTVDERYYCVSVEHTDYRPVLLEHVLAKLPKVAERPNEVVL